MDTISGRADTRRCHTLRPVAVRRTRIIALSRPRWSASSAGPWLRLRVWRRSVQLDRVLAEGSPPADCAQLELRVQQLASARVRWALARAFRAVAGGTERPSTVPTLAPLIIVPPLASPRDGSRPTPAANALLDLADALTEPGCTSAQGIARASWLLCDVTSSPLYARLPARTLQRIVFETITALHGAP